LGLIAIVLFLPEAVGLEIDFPAAPELAQSTDLS
jgi:hypothetical protein